MFTSPHLICVTERIRLNGKPVSKEEFTNGFWIVFNKLQSRHDQIAAEGKGMSFGGLDLPSHPPYFRFLTLLAIYIFKNHNFAENTQDDISGSGVTDTMLLEVGIGGRYDATNLFTSAKATCVTTLDYDHCRTLGYKLSEIAFEKGGIMKPNVAAFTSPQETSALEKLGECADDVDTTLVTIDNEYDLINPLWKLGLQGDFQKMNAALAVAMSMVACGDKKSDEVLANKGIYDEEIRQALGDSRWPGRCQTIEYVGDEEYGDCTFCIDGAHTTKSMNLSTSWFYEEYIKSGFNQENIIGGGGSGSGDGGGGGDFDGVLTKKRKLEKEAKKKKRKVLLFNCSHERNPIELLKIAIDSKIEFDVAIFCAALSERPSAIKKSSALELMKEENVVSVKLGEDEILSEENTWQDTLAILWRNLSSNSTHDIYSFPGITKAIEFIKSEDSVVLCCGSLYLVGSLLEGLNWSEEEAKGSLKTDK